jgi:sugar lactone lactonase YvrE
VSRRFVAGLLLIIAGALIVVALLPHRARESADVPAPAAVTAAPPSTRVGVPGRYVWTAGDGNAGLQEGAAAQARFADPYGIAVAADGTIYVSDAGENNRIRRIGTDGSVSTLAGASEGFVDGSAAAARFNTPSGLALDADGTLYVADTGNHAIRKVTPQGVVTTLAGTGVAGFHDGAASEAQFDGPIGIAVDRQRRVYVADTYNDRIRLIDTDGRVSTLAGGDRPGYQDGAGIDARFDTPCALAVDDAGTLWIADTRNNAIRTLKADGSVGTFVAVAEGDANGVPRWPLALALAHDGILYVGELAHGAVLQYAADGGMTVLTGASTLEGRLLQPAGLALDRAGAVYVSDAASARVHKIVAQTEGDSTPALASPIGPAPDAPLPQSDRRWPVAPQDAWHEIVGTLGEVRGNDKGDSRDHLHGGLDIRADVGSTVLAIADAKVSSPLAAWRFGELSEGLVLDTLDYIHMRVGRTPQNVSLDPERFIVLRDENGKPARMRVRRGTRFKAGDALGSVNAMAHVHLALDGNAGGRNAIALGFSDFADHVAPSIDSVRLFDASGQALSKKEHGKLLVARDEQGIRIVVDAWDHVDDNLPRRRLGLYALGYQILHADGTPAPGFETPQMTIEFNRLPLDEQAPKLIYDEKSGETVHGSAMTHFRYVVTNLARDGRVESGRWQTATLPPGDYIVRIIARDYSGNVARRNRDTAVTLQ